ncbi:MAG TPA: vitamin K epoxide reductase family protein, partial [Nocardioides sp.]|nr:vitamin K epoxide reductase family protein [Nocardioides sp.]
ALGLAVLTLARSARVAAYAENLRLAASAVGVAMVAYLIWAEVQVGAICLWCTGVHVVTLALFVLSLFVVVLRDPSDT